VIQFRGRTFAGLDGSRWYNGGPNQYTEAQMKKKIRSLGLKLWRTRKLDVMITHAPPRFIHDAEDPCHRGFKTFRSFIDRHSPGYLIHGHIHKFFTNPAARGTLINRTRVINTFGYHIIEIDDGKTD
jgi:Icc-related predicted phosphoesterase